MAKYGKAKQTTRFDSRYPGSYASGFTYRGVLHTTEGRGLPAYSGGAVAPHFTIDPTTGVVHQHFDTSRPARALEHRAGTIDTNNARAVQIEIIAYSDKAAAKKANGLHVDDFTEAHYANIRALMRWIEGKCAIKPTHVAHTKPYPASYGDSNGVRIGDAAWRTFSGWCEHQNVPHNNHGDAGGLDLARLMPQPKPQPSKPKGKPRMLIHEKGEVHVYLVDGIHRHHCKGQAGIDAAQAVLKVAGLPATVTTVPKGTLDLYGALVGPDWNTES